MTREPTTAGKLWWRDDDGPRRELVTPEGVPLSFAQAAVGDRLVAFLVDVILILVTLIALTVAAVTLVSESSLALTGVAWFLGINFYFVWFEYRWQGRTPGKRTRSLRVVDARGGFLTVESIIVRNLTRYVEVFLPLAVLLAPEVVWPDAPAWVRLAASLWVISLAAMPLFNRQRRRVGDLVAGTLVVRTPAAKLLTDLAAAPPRVGERAAADDAPASPWTFSDAQLDRYGVYELQVLEEVLRNPNPFGAESALATISRKIRARIGYDGDVTDHAAFLRAFYTAQRAHLERRLLLGQRRADKHAGQASPPGPSSSPEDVEGEVPPPAPAADEPPAAG